MLLLSGENRPETGELVSNGTPRGTLGTVHNAATLLRLMSEGPSHQQLTDLAERSNLSLATVHRLLRSLTSAGLAEQDPRSSRYGLGPELVRLAESYLSRHPVLSIAAPYLVELRNTTGATVQVATLVGLQLVLLDRIDGRDAGGVYRDARRVHDPTTSALGRLLLAHDDDAWQQVRDDEHFTDDDRELWQKEDLLVHVPASPTAVADVASPIRERGGEVSVAISVLGPATTPDNEGLREDIGPLVVRAATTISRALGGA